MALRARELRVGLWSCLALVAGAVAAVVAVVLSVQELRPLLDGQPAGAPHASGRAVTTGLRDVIGAFSEALHESVGQLRSKEYPGTCLNVPVSVESIVERAFASRRVVHAAVGIGDCLDDADTLSQRWEVNSHGQLKHIVSGMCVGVQEASNMAKFFSDGGYVVLQSCGSPEALETKQRWALSDEGLLQNQETGECLRAVVTSTADTKPRLKMSECKTRSYFGSRKLYTGVGWEWRRVYVDTHSAGFIQNKLNRKCVDSQPDSTTLAECEFHQASTGQMWRLASDGSFKNVITSECLLMKPRADSRSKLKLVTGECEGSESWEWTDAGRIRNNHLGLCMDVEGDPAECVGHEVIMNDCKAGGDHIDKLWRLVPFAQVPKAPSGSPERELPDEVSSPSRGIKAVLVKRDHECRSKDTSLGFKSTLTECLLNVHREGGKRFVYGTYGWRKGKCFIELTDSDLCTEGWKASYYHFYKIVGFEERAPLPFEVQMGELASETYNELAIGSDVAGWTVVAECNKRAESFWSQWSSGKDLFHLFARGDKCVLAFAGTDDAKDALADLNGVKTRAACGVKFHQGFLGELIDYMKSNCWSKDVAPVLASGRCSGGRIVVGHSLGAAIAASLAHCANVNGGDGGLNELVPGTTPFTVTGLYTFGAPGPALEPLTNGMSQNGCFPGMRFFNLDAGGFDPIPWAASVVKFVHPKMDATLIYEDSFGYVSQTDLPCRTDESEYLPLSDILCRPIVSDHYMHRYLYRLERLLAPLAVAPGPGWPVAV